MFWVFKFFIVYKPLIIIALIFKEIGQLFALISILSMSCEKYFSDIFEINTEVKEPALK